MPTSQGFALDNAKGWKLFGTTSDWYTTQNFTDALHGRYDPTGITAGYNASHILPAHSGSFYAGFGP